MPKHGDIAMDEAVAVAVALGDAVAVVSKALQSLAKQSKALDFEFMICPDRGAT